MLPERVGKWLKSKHMTEKHVPSCIKKISPGVYVIELFRPEIVKLWVEEVANMKKFFAENKIPSEPPNPSNWHGVQLDNFETFTPGFTELIQTVITPLSKKLFSDMGEDSLDSHSAFTVAYGQHQDRKLGRHVDNSEITVNLCLEGDFKGGELEFQGVRCQKHIDTKTFWKTEHFKYIHKAGLAVIHVGNHYHAAFPIVNGSRSGLILHCRSTKFREENEKVIFEDYIK